MKILMRIVLLGLLVLGIAWVFAPSAVKETAWSLAPLIFSVQKTIDTPLPLPENLPYTVPEGFDVSVFAKDIPGARDMTRDPKGALLVSLTGTGKIVALPDTNSDNKTDAAHTVLEGLNKPHGIVVQCPYTGNTSVDQDNCVLFVAEETAVRSYAYDADTFTAQLKETVAELPGGGGHSTRTLLPHPDGRLLVSVGSSCNVCNERDERRASVLAIDLNKKTTAPFAKGLRNTVFMAIHPVTGDIWGTDNGRDLLGDNIPPDEVNILREGGNYGWPICYGKNIHDTEFDDNTYIRAPCQEPFEIPSHLDVPAHSAALGIGFIPEEGWPESYWFDALVAYHGSWNRSEPTGYKIVQFDLDPQGNPTGTVSDFMTGFRNDAGQIIGRPVGILIEPGGTLYVSDDRAGAIYRVFRTEL